jgi:exodeoxyribonuclease VII large subunit
MQPGLLTGFISRERRLLQDRAARLGPALARLSRDTARDNARRKGELAAFAERLTIAQRTRLDALAQSLASLDRTRQTLGYTETLRRGYAVIRAEGAVVTTKASAEAAALLEIEFADGRLPATPGATSRPRKAKGDTGPDQGNLF